MFLCLLNSVTGIEHDWKYGAGHSPLRPMKSGQDSGLLLLGFQQIGVPGSDGVDDQFAGQL